MKHFLRLLITLFLLFGVQARLLCQEAGEYRWDELLDRFERICKMCLTLKGERDSGADIRDSQIAPLLGELSSLRDELADVGDRMPAHARQRYENIRKMYVSGQISDTSVPFTVPSLNEIKSLPPAVVLRSWFPDAVEHLSPGPLKYRWNLAVGAVVVPEFSAGVRAGFLGSRWGAYAACYSNFSYHAAAAKALSDGTMEGGLIWTSGCSAVDRFFITAGPVLRLGDVFSVYGGLGYGLRKVCWEDSEGGWMEITDISRRGICAELGAGIQLGRCMITAGWLALPSSYNGLTVSLGYSFGTFR